MAVHAIHKCACGQILLQCRCLGLHEEVVTASECFACRPKAAPADEGGTFRASAIAPRPDRGPGYD